MGPVGIGLIVCGLLFGAAGWGLTRADRLTFGQGALCVLAGVGLVLGGWLLNPLAAVLVSFGWSAPEGMIVLLILAAALALFLRQAVALSRVSKELRRLATQCALDGERPPAAGGA